MDLKYGWELGIRTIIWLFEYGNEIFIREGLMSYGPGEWLSDSQGLCSMVWSRKTDHEFLTVMEREVILALFHFHPSSLTALWHIAFNLIQTPKLGLKHFAETEPQSLSNPDASLNSFSKARFWTIITWPYYISHWSLYYEGTWIETICPL